MARRNFVAELMNEKICYGGLVATRAEVYQDCIDAGATQRIADFAAFGGAPYTVLSPEEIEYMESQGRTLAAIRERELSAA